MLKVFDLLLNGNINYSLFVNRGKLHHCSCLLSYICIHYALCYFNICIIISIIACHMPFLHGFVEIKTIKLITSFIYYCFRP